MLIHNKKKKFILSIVNIFIELICLPQKIFSSKTNFLKTSPDKILLIRLDHIGDVVMTSPAFSLLRERFPESKILLLTNSAGKELFSNDPRINEVLAFNWPWGQQKVKERFLFSKIKELFHLIVQLRKENLDILIDFRGDLRFIVLFGVLTQTKIKISNSRSGKSSLLNHISDYDISRHEVERSLDVIECMVNSKGEVRPEIYLKNTEISSAKRFVESEIKVPFPSKLAIIAPYSSRDVKSWPSAYFGEVISYLRKNDFTVIVVGTKDDKDSAEDMISEFPNNVFSSAGRTSARELAALISISTLVVGVDTGVLHIASCFDIPIVAIFGPTRSIEFRPYSAHCHLVQTNTCKCNQFMHLKCDCPVDGYAYCLYNLKPSSVIHEISKIMAPQEISKLQEEL
jgi:ADP-heptose:LPS heptosyltransferase